MYKKETFRNLDKEWGTTINDTHFIHYGYTGSNNDYNTGHIDNRFIFHMIGDLEVMSASYNNNRIMEQDFSNIHNFKNFRIWYEKY